LPACPHVAERGGELGFARQLASDLVGPGGQCRGAATTGIRTGEQIILAADCDAVREVLVRNLRDRRAVARYAGLTGAPDESGAKRPEKGLAKAGNARVRRSLIQLAWQFLVFQKDSALARWYVGRTSGPNGARRTTMIVALARKLLIALWRLATTGVVPEGVVLRPAA
jgi:hypothetical protein